MRARRDGLRFVLRDADKKRNCTGAAFMKKGPWTVAVPFENDGVASMVDEETYWLDATAYVRGTNKLVNGSCTVQLPEHFAVVVTASLTVNVTPLSVSSLGLAVTSKSTDKIVVQELHSGTGTYDFDWEVKGVRTGHEAYRVIQPRRGT